MQPLRTRKVAGVLLLALAPLGPGCASDGAARGGAAERAPAPLAPFTVTLPGSGVTLAMVPVPAGEVDGRAVAAFWMSRTEVTWDAFDVFLHGAGSDGVDAVTRPSVPYVSVDRGFGHEGWPAISLTARGARAFCDWLSAATGRTFRLPTVDEWERAARTDAEELAGRAWHRGNSGGTTHPVASLPPNALGLHDLAGNAGEWCVDERGRALVCGGTYQDELADVGPGARKTPSPAWNASDPQIPKSTWWFADAGFTGLRLVCERPPEETERRGPER